MGLGPDIKSAVLFLGMLVIALHSGVNRGKPRLFTTAYIAMKRVLNSLDL